MVTPKEPFIKWVQSSGEAAMVTTVEEILEGPNVYLVDDSIDVMGEERLLKKNFAGIFEEELNGWIIDETMWPQKCDIKHILLSGKEDEPSMREGVLLMPDRNGRRNLTQPEGRRA